LPSADVEERQRILERLLVVKEPFDVRRFVGIQQRRIILAVVPLGWILGRSQMFGTSGTRKTISGFTRAQQGHAELS